MNRFDMDSGELAGIGSSLRKLGKKFESAVRHGVQRVNDHRLKVDDKINKGLKKIMPKPITNAREKVQDWGREADKKGYTKIAAAVALSFVNPTFSTKAAALAFSAAQGAAVSSALRSGAKDYATVKAEESVERMTAEYVAAEAAAAGQLSQAIRDLPEFQQVVDELRAQGYSDLDIANHWAESRSYYEQAVAAARNAVAPAIATEAARQGYDVTNPQVGQLIDQTAGMVAQQGVKLAQAEVKQAAGLPLIMGAGILLSLLM